MTRLYLCAVLAILAVALKAGAEPDPPPNVVLLSVDTLRADHLGLYGYRFNTSPTLDRLAQEALVFDDCVCEVPLTNPSFGAMLSGLYPRMTGTTQNGLPMPDTTPLVPEAFRARGYQTMCVQSNWTLRPNLSGLNRGFDVYEDDFHDKRWALLKPERYGDRVTDTAIRLLRERDADRPFFFWIHYSDPHAPYRYHPEHNPSGVKLSQVQGRDRVSPKYDSEIAFTDDQIGRLLKSLPRENTYILFVADHGECLYENGYLGHGRRIYQGCQRVPLFVVGPGIEPDRTGSPVCTFDVGPTLLKLAGIEPLPGMLGRNLIENGRVASIPAGRARFIETYGGAVPKIPGVKALVADNKPMRRGMIHEGWKLILGGERPELYYLPDDPAEQRNLAKDQPERVAEFTKRVELWNKEHPKGKTEPALLSEDDRRALESLGYLE